MNTNLISKLPAGLITLAKHLSDDLVNSDVYLVGGAVRDLILGRSTKDHDLVVGGIETAQLEHWLANHGQVNLVGKNFGVFKWQPAGWPGDIIDVALPRTEHSDHYTGQYRDFSIQSDPNLPIDEDLKRRDFTINALALNLTTGELTDPTNGQLDLKTKIIRAVGNPKDRFNEDLSRTLRGLRFACQLNFAIEPNTLEAIKNTSEKAALGQTGTEWLVPREIIAREIIKAFVGDPVRALELFAETNFINTLLPEVAKMKNTPQPPQFHSEGDVWAHTKLALSAFTEPEWQEFFGQAKPNINTIIATLLHDIGKPLTLTTPKDNGTDRLRTDGHDTAGAKLIPEICERLKLTSYTDPERGRIIIENVVWLVEHHLLIVHGPPDILKPSTIYRYFWKDQEQGLALQQLIFADSYATKPTDGRVLTDNLKKLQQRIYEVGKNLDTGKLKLLLTGDDIMKKFKLTAGPKVGELLKLLEEAQLEKNIKTRTQAEDYLSERL